MAASTRPASTLAGLGPRGKRLWRGLNKDVTLDAAQIVVAEEACRMADRLDRLDSALCGRDFLTMKVKGDLSELMLTAADSGVLTVEVHLVVDGALGEARQQANVLKQLLAALRLPDDVAAGGKRPQARGGARGAYSKPVTGPAPAPAAAAGNVTPIERARRAASATP